MSRRDNVVARERDLGCCARRFRVAVPSKTAEPEACNLRRVSLEPANTQLPDDDPDVQALGAGSRDGFAVLVFVAAVFLSAGAMAVIYNGSYISGPFYDAKMAGTGMLLSFPFVLGLYGLLGAWLRSGGSPQGGFNLLGRVRGIGALVLLLGAGLLFAPCAVPFVRNRRSLYGFAARGGGDGGGRRRGLPSSPRTSR